MFRRAGAIAVLSFLGTCGISWADEARGTIQKVDTEKGEVVIQLRGKGVRGLTLTVAVDKDTQFKVGGQPAKLSDLETGSRARLIYENRDGRRIARGITVSGGNLLKGLLPKDTTAPPEIASPQASDGNTVSGVLMRVAQTDREIVVVGPGAKGERELETTIVVPEKVAISRDAKSVKFEDLKEGELVTVQVARHGKKTEAQTIQIGKGTPPKAAAKNPRIERLREMLRMADALLQQMAEGGKP